METTKFELRDGINAKSHRKENYFYGGYQLIVFDAKQKDDYHKGFFVAVDLRLYASNAKNYACVWINDREKGLHASGSGTAGGYGYHRASAASSEAFQSAGVEFNEDINGRGDSAIVGAIDAIAKKLGYKNYFINHTHA